MQFAFVFAVIKSSKAGIAPFQSRGTLIHTPRTRWLCPGCLLRKPPDGTDRRRTSVGRIRFGPGFLKGLQRFNAGWSSPVARQAHNLKVIGSNPIPATNDSCDTSEGDPEGSPFAFRSGRVLRSPRALADSGGTQHNVGC